MPANHVPFYTELTWVLLGALVLFLGALTMGLHQRPTVEPGSKGHRDRAEEKEGEAEEVRPDGYIESFAGVIEEAGGSMPPVVRLALPAIIGWWLAYLILNWTQ